MMNKNPNKFLQVDNIYIRNEPEPLKNRVVFIMDHFVIVARDQNDTAPTWYNVEMIEKLEGVR